MDVCRQETLVKCPNRVFTICFGTHVEQRPITVRVGLKGCEASYSRKVVADISMNGINGVYKKSDSLSNIRDPVVVFGDGVGSLIVDPVDPERARGEEREEEAQERGKDERVHGSLARRARTQLT